ncbi:hypothetical protein [Tuanshanicoccus yangjingiae]
MKAIEGEKIDSTIPIAVKFVKAEEIVEYGKAKAELSTTTTE